MSKYEPFGELLKDQAEDDFWLTFQEVEKRLGFKLPRSARAHSAWWANERTTHVQARAWMDVGLRVWEVDRSREKVRFTRRAPGPQAAASQPAKITVDLTELTPAANKLVNDYAREMGGNFAAAVFRGLHEAAIARRSRLIDRIRANAPVVPGDSTDLIREDRDAR